MAKRRTLRICLLLLVASAACVSGPDPELASITRNSRRVVPDLLLHRAQSQLQESVRGVVRTRSGWEAFLEDAFGPGAPDMAGEVDFDRSLVAVAAMGARATGGFNVSIREAYVRQDSMFVLVRHTMPGRNCVVPQVRTSPVEAVTLPRTAGEVRFVVQERTLTCE